MLHSFHHLLNNIGPTCLIKFGSRKVCFSYNWGQIRKSNYYSTRTKIDNNSNIVKSFRLILLISAFCEFLQKKKVNRKFKQEVENINSLTKYQYNFGLIICCITLFRTSRMLSIQNFVYYQTEQKIKILEQIHDQNIRGLPYSKYLSDSKKKISISYFMHIINKLFYIRDENVNFRLFSIHVNCTIKQTRPSNQPHPANPIL